MSEASGSPEAIFERYREIVPEWKRFQEVARAPEPTVFRVRTGRIRPDALRRRLEEQGFRLRELDAPEDFFRVVEAPHRVTHTLEHWLGLIYVQQAVTGLAARALDPAPGDRVLDMCAAPGGKTTHVADLAGDRTALVAADRNDKRMRGLLGNVYRAAHPGVLSLTADGRAFPAGATFDRVLVDAPCSAEGNVRRHGGEPPEQSPSFLEYVTRTQEALLRRAVELTRPGGIVLYVTCTFNPDENEAVVDAVLGDTGVEVRTLELSGRSGATVPHAPGLTAFEGREFHPSLERAWRLYPHHLDSGGLFMVKLRKEGSEEARGWSPVPWVAPGDAASPEEATSRVRSGLARVAEKFGIPESVLEQRGWLVRGDSVWGHTLPAWPVESWSPDEGWRLLSLGIRALKEDRRFGERVTNDFLRWMGPHLTNRVVRLSREDCLRLLEGEHLDPPGRWKGIVALALGGWVIGRGVSTGRGLRHEIPKARAKRLREILERREGEAPA